MKQFLHRSLVFLEKKFGKVKRRRPIPVEQMVVENYDGFSNHKTVVIRGRVLKESAAWEFRESDSGWRNFRGITRYWLTREIPNITVRGEICGAPFEAITDEEGYFTIESPRSAWLEESGRWQEYETWVDGGQKRFTGRVQVLHQEAERIIISDIDDTVMETGARQLWQMVKTTLFKNVHTRTVFPGVSKFYRALLNRDRNPIYYVTSSPWNLRAFIQQVFQLREIPEGPSFMTDWGLDEEKLLKEGHGRHKYRAIKRVLDFHPELSCVLIGDSGEKDPEIYTDVVSKFPDRVEVVYIRDVSEDIRDEQVRKLATTCANNGVPLILVDDTAKAAQDARERKIIGTAASLELQSADETSTWVMPALQEQEA